MVHIVMSNRLNADSGWTDLCGLESVSVDEPFGNRAGRTGSRDARWDALKRAPHGAGCSRLSVVVTVYLVPAAYRIVHRKEEKMEEAHW
jgi:hypothetical protein